MTVKVSTSFTSTPILRKQLAVLSAQNGENTSQTIVRLIAEAYAKLMAEKKQR